VDGFKPGERLSAARLNEIVARVLDVIAVGDGLELSRCGGRLTIRKSGRDRGMIPIEAGNMPDGGAGVGGTFVAAVASGYFPVDTAWTDTDIGLSATAKAFLLGVFVDTSGGLLDFATYASRDAGGGPFYIRVNDGYNCIVTPASGHASGGRVLTRLTGSSSGIITWTCLGYWT